jgi:hypothetical protein
MRTNGKNTLTNSDTQGLKTPHANIVANEEDTHPTTMTRTMPTNQRITTNNNNQRTMMNPLLRNNHNRHRTLLLLLLLLLLLHHHLNTTKGVTKEIETEDITDIEMEHIINPIHPNNMRKRRNHLKIIPTRTTIEKTWDEHFSTP